ncbi:hypothetical protein ACOSQ3_016535 [Xanthoceras sorbifolium]
MDTREVERLCEALFLAEPNKHAAVLDVELQKIGKKKLELCLAGRLIETFFGLSYRKFGGLCKKWRLKYYETIFLVSTSRIRWIRCRFLLEGLGVLTSPY